MNEDLFNREDNKIVDPIGASMTPTPYAVFCPNHGKVYLTTREYNYQMSRADDLWQCPLCPVWVLAQFDDDNYELYFGEDGPEGDGQDKG